MSTSGTFRVPELELTKEEDIKIFSRNVVVIKALMNEQQKLVDLNTPNRQDALNQLEYHKEQYKHFYDKLSSVLDEDQQKIDLTIKEEIKRVENDSPLFYSDSL